MRYHSCVATEQRIEKLVRQMAANPANVKFSELRTVCEHNFGSPRQHGSHLVFSMQWPGDPRVNIQAAGAKAKPYQVKQVLAAIEKKEGMR
ncbi:toxin HicA [Skermania sp. ID1734]|nr:toxin HicA [Skermania sp. ID1734]